MQTAEQVAREILDSLPDDCTLDDIQYHLFVRRSVERGLKDIEEGRVFSIEDMERRLGQWLVSSGRRSPATPR
jgi:predicted transcriptional regulator